MTLQFLNNARSYDEHRRRVRFTGYDGMFQVEFAVEVSAFETTPQQDTEGCHLMAFDKALATVRTTAERVYRKKRQKMTVLTAADFR